MTDNEKAMTEAEKIAVLEGDVERLRREAAYGIERRRELEEMAGDAQGRAFHWSSRAKAAEAKVAKVGALHRPSGDIAGSTAAKLAERFGSACMHCAVPWPCPTIAVLADAPAEP